jgi:hypothetical protein
LPFFRDSRYHADIRHSIVSGLRPELPLVDDTGVPCPEKIRGLMERCWHQDPSKRPGFTAIRRELEAILRETAAE